MGNISYEELSRIYNEATQSHPEPSGYFADVREARQVFGNDYVDRGLVEGWIQYTEDPNEVVIWMR